MSSDDKESDEYNDDLSGLWRSSFSLLAGGGSENVTLSMIGDRDHTNLFVNPRCTCEGYCSCVCVSVC